MEWSVCKNEHQRSNINFYQSMSTCLVSVHRGKYVEQTFDVPVDVIKIYSIWKTNVLSWFVFLILASLYWLLILFRHILFTSKINKWFVTYSPFRAATTFMFPGPLSDVSRSHDHIIWTIQLTITTTKSVTLHQKDLSHNPSLFFGF